MNTLLRITNSNLECLDSTGTMLWSLPIESIVLVAEYTSDEGPYFDDYFLVIVTVEECKFYFSTCALYSGGSDEVLSILGERLGSPIQLGLIFSTKWQSRVTWPAEMAGTEYFTFTTVPAETLVEKFKKSLLGPTYEYAISKRVQEYLREQLASNCL